MALIYIEPISRAFPRIDAAAFAIVAYILALVGLLRKESFIALLVAFCASIAAVILIDLAYLALVVVIPAAPFFRLPNSEKGFGINIDESATNLMFGLVAAAVVIALLSLFGVPLMGTIAVGLLAAILVVAILLAFFS